MKNILKSILLTGIFLATPIVAQASGTPTVYGVHTPVETSLAGIEWIFVLASFVFFLGLTLVTNGKALNSQIDRE